MIVRAKTPKGLSWAGRIAVLGMAALFLPLAPSWAQKSESERATKEQREFTRKRAEAVGAHDRQAVALKQQFALERMAYLRSELLDVQSQKRKVEARLKMQQHVEPTTEAEIKHWMDQDPVIAGLIAKLAKDEERFKAENLRIRALARSGEADPAMRLLKNDIAASRKSLESKRAERRLIAVQQLQDQKKSEQVAKSKGIEQELAMLDDLEKRLTEEIKSVDKENLSLALNSLTLRETQNGDKKDDTVNNRIKEEFKKDPEVLALTREINDIREYLDRIKRNPLQSHDPARVAAQNHFDKLQQSYNDLWESKYPELLAQFTTNDDKDDDKKEEKTRDAAERLQEQLKDLIAKLGKELSPVAEEVRKALEQAVGEVHKSLEKDGLSAEELGKALERSQENLRKAFEGGGPVDKELREAIEKGRKDMEEAFDRARGDAQDQVESLRQRSRELRDQARENFDRARGEAERRLSRDGDEQPNRDELESARKEIRDLQQQLERATRRFGELQRREWRRNDVRRPEANPQPEPQPQNPATPRAEPAPPEPPKEPAAPATPARPNARRPSAPIRPAPGVGRRGPQTENDRRLHELEDKMNQLLKELKNLKEEKNPKESK
jgi:hypothetical protein